MIRTAISPRLATRIFMKRVRQELTELLRARASDVIVTLEITEAAEETEFLTTEVAEETEFLTTEVAEETEDSFKVAEHAETTNRLMAEMTTIASQQIAGSAPNDP